MLNRQAVMDEIGKTLARSTRLTEQAKARHRGSVEAAFSGAGFASETTAKLAMIRKIQPNSGFAKGSVADTFGSTGHPSDELFPQGTGEIHQFSTEELVDAGPKPDAPEYYARFREIMASQYPTIPAMQNVTPPTPGGTFEQRYSQSTAPRYEPTSGPPIIASPDKARTMPLQKSVADTRLAKLERLEALVGLLAAYVGGDDAAGVVLGIR
jgi:hypothetical protein